jgi:hypothetical protein
VDRLAVAGIRDRDPADRLERLPAHRGRQPYIAHLNGIKIIDFTDPTPKSFDGYIVLQLHSGGLGNMRFKDLFIRDLSHR